MISVLPNQICWGQRYFRSWAWNSTHPVNLSSRSAVNPTPAGRFAQIWLRLPRTSLCDLVIGYFTHSASSLWTTKRKLVTNVYLQANRNNESLHRPYRHRVCHSCFTPWPSVDLPHLAAVSSIALIFLPPLLVSILNIAAEGHFRQGWAVTGVHHYCPLWILPLRARRGTGDGWFTTHLWCRPSLMQFPPWSSRLLFGQMLCGLSLESESFLTADVDS